VSDAEPRCKLGTEDPSVNMQEPQLQLRKALVKARSRIWVDPNPSAAPAPAPEALVRPRGSPAASFELILKRPKGSVAPSEPPAPTLPSQLQRKPPLPAPRLAGPPARSVNETEVRPVNSWL